MAIGKFNYMQSNVFIVIQTFLFSINVKIKKGSFVAIVGQVGSGKSSLINSLLGELHKNKGRIGIEVRTYTHISS